MSTKQSTIDFLLDQVGDLKNVRARKMFGEYALYVDEKVVALVCNDELYVKITEPGKRLVGSNYREGFAYPGAKPSIHISADLLEDREFLKKLMTVTASVLPLPKPKKSRPSGRNLLQ